MADLSMAGGPAAGAPPLYRGLRVVSNSQLEAVQQAEDEARRQAEIRPNQQQYVGLAGYIRTQWNMMVRHRNTIAGWSDRLLDAMRTFNGVYSPQKLAEIRRFGGSEVYCRLVAAKC